LLIGHIIFADTSNNSVNFTYLRYFEDLELVVDYVWGPAVLTHLYMGLPTIVAASGGEGGYKLHNTASGNQLYKIKVFLKLMLIIF
jgi:hypothetical protein